MAHHDANRGGLSTDFQSGFEVVDITGASQDYTGAFRHSRGFAYLGVTKVSVHDLRSQFNNPLPTVVTGAAVRNHHHVNSRRHQFLDHLKAESSESAHNHRSHDAL